MIVCVCVCIKDVSEVKQNKGHKRGCISFSMLLKLFTFEILCLGTWYPRNVLRILTLGMMNATAIHKTYIAIQIKSFIIPEYLRMSY